MQFQAELLAICLIELQSTLRTVFYRNNTRQLNDVLTGNKSELNVLIPKYFNLIMIEYDVSILNFDYLNFLFYLKMKINFI